METDPRGGTAPVGVEEKRRTYAGVAARAGAPAAVARINDETAKTDSGSVPVRVYAGDSAGTDAQNRAVVVYLHGGAFISGSLDTHEPVCRAIARRAACTVVAVDYRLAPENPYPAALVDAQIATAWAAARWPDSRLVVAGDSAGGNLAAAIALWARDEGNVALAAQVLLYPVLDATLTGSSLIENGLLPPFTLLDCLFMWQKYLPLKVDRRHPYISPLLAATLARLPRTFLLTAEFDVLRSEGMAYAERLAANAVAVEHWDVPGMPHGFVQWGGTVPEGREALERVGAFVSALP